MADGASTGIAGVLVGALIVGVVLMGALFLTGTFGPSTAVITTEPQRPAPSTARTQ